MTAERPPARVGSPAKRKALLFGILALASVATILLLRAFGVDLDRLLVERDRLLALVSAHVLASALLFVVLYIVVVAVSIPGATVLTLLGGFFFGPLLGVVLVNLGATTGALLVFLAARYLLRGALMERYGTQLAALNRELAKNGANYLLTLRFIPLFPFFLINILAGLTPVSTLTYLWTTAVGIIPGSIVYSLLGSSGAALGTEKRGLSPQLVAGLVLLAVLSLLPVVIRKVRDRRDRVPSLTGRKKTS
jgi:uncharacterized membrane protein YdjX (TVP38/TMEM64 family)